MRLKFGIEISMLEEKSLMVLIVLEYTIKKNQHLNQKSLVHSRVVS